MNTTKNNLLKITRNIIDNDGIEAVSMRKIGSKANLSRSAVYRHFLDKDSLLAEIVIENFKKFIINIEMIEKNAKNLHDFIKLTAYSYYDFGVNNKDHYILMFNKNWDENKHPDVKNNAMLLFRKISKFIEDDNSIKKSPVVVTSILYAFIHGLVNLNITGHTTKDKELDNPKKLIDFFIELI